MPLANALATLHETQPGGQWLDEAVCMADTILYQFADPATGGFFYTPADHEPLVAPMKDLFDSSTPSGTGLAVTASCDSRRLPTATTIAVLPKGRCFPVSTHSNKTPTAAGQMLLALDMLLNKPQ